MKAGPNDMRRHGTAVKQFKALCPEMQKLRKMLTAAGIKWRDLSACDNLNYFDICRTRFAFRGNEWSVIHGFGTYGGWGGFAMEDRGLLEVMLVSGGDNQVQGWLKAEEVMNLIYNRGDGDE